MNVKDKAMALTQLIAANADLQKSFPGLGKLAQQIVEEDLCEQRLLDALPEQRRPPVNLETQYQALEREGMGLKAKETRLFINVIDLADKESKIKITRNSL